MGKLVDRDSGRRVGAELKEICEQHPALKHPIAQQHLQEWIEAQQNDESPEALCARFAKTIVELASVFQAQHGNLTDNQIETTLRASIELWEKRNG